MPQIRLVLSILASSALSYASVRLVRGFLAFDSRRRPVIVDSILVLLLYWQYYGLLVQGLAWMRRLACGPDEALLVDVTEPMDVLPGLWQAHSVWLATRSIGLAADHSAGSDEASDATDCALSVPSCVGVAAVKVVGAIVALRPSNRRLAAVLDSLSVAVQGLVVPCRGPSARSVLLRHLSEAAGLRGAHGRQGAVVDVASAWSSRCHSSIHATRACAWPVLVEVVPDAARV